MIIELLLSPIFLLVKGFLEFIPNGYNLPSWSSDFVKMVSVSLSFFPAPVFAIVVSNIVFWLGAHMVWAIIEWLYKKIPGIN